MSKQSTEKGSLPRGSQLTYDKLGTQPLVFWFSSLSNNSIPQAGTHGDTCSALTATVLSPPLPRLSRSLSIRDLSLAKPHQNGAYFVPCSDCVMCVCVHLCVLYVCVYSNQSSQPHYERHTFVRDLQVRKVRLRKNK